VRRSSLVTRRSRRPFGASGRLDRLGGERRRSVLMIVYIARRPVPRSAVCRVSHARRSPAKRSWSVVPAAMIVDTERARAGGPRASCRRPRATSGSPRSPVPVLTSFGGGTDSSKLNSGVAAGATVSSSRPTSMAVARSSRSSRCSRRARPSVVGAPVVAVWPLHALATTMTDPATSTLVLRLRTVDTLGSAVRKITMGKFGHESKQ